MVEVSPYSAEARASQDVYGSGPQSFPYVGYFYDPNAYGSGGSAGGLSAAYVYVYEGYPPLHVGDVHGAVGSIQTYRPITRGLPDVDIKIPSGGGTVILPIYV